MKERTLTNLADLTLDAPPPAPDLAPPMPEPAPGQPVLPPAPQPSAIVPPMPSPVWRTDQPRPPLTVPAISDANLEAVSEGIRMSNAVRKATSKLDAPARARLLDSAMRLIHGQGRMRRGWNNLRMFLAFAWIQARIQAQEVDRWFVTSPRGGAGVIVALGLTAVLIGGLFSVWPSAIVLAVAPIVYGIHTILRRDARIESQAILRASKVFTLVDDQEEAQG